MLRTETVTAIADAHDWRGPLVVQLVTAVEHRTNRAGDAAHTLRRYEIHTGRDAESVRLNSLFESAEARDAVAHRMYGDAAFLKTTSDRAQPRTARYPPAAMVGRTATAFRNAAPGPVSETSLTIELGLFAFTALVWPELRVNEKPIAGSDPRYYDRLCRIVGEKLLVIDEFIDEGLFLEFSDGTALSIIPPPWYGDDSGQLASMRGPSAEFDWWGPYDTFAPPGPHSTIGWWT